MPAYKFEALDAAGKATSGLLEADNAKAARAQLRAQALVPLDVIDGRRRPPTTAGGLALQAPRLQRAPAWRSGRASSPAWSARACRWSAR